MLQLISTVSCACAFLVGSALHEYAHVYVRERGELQHLLFLQLHLDFYLLFVAQSLLMDLQL